MYGTVLRYIRYTGTASCYPYVVVETKQEKRADMGDGRFCPHI